MRFFAPLTKIDAEQRMVYGYASTETRDSDGELIKRSAIESALPDYLKFSNIREMHQASAVGVCKIAELDDRGLFVGGKIIDDVAWGKVQAGVYKGFSIGGKSLERDPADRTVVTKVRLSEISLVDRPANPECVFDMWKADAIPSPQGGSMHTPKAGSLLAKMCDLKKVSADDIHTLMNTAAELSEDASLPKQLKKPIAALLAALEGMTMADLKSLADGTDAAAATETPETPDTVPKPDASVAAKDDSVSMAEKTHDIQKRTVESLDALTKELTKLSIANKTMADRIEKLEKQPAPAKGAVKSIEKAQDIDAPVQKKELDPKTATAADLIKASFAKPLAQLG